MSVLGIGVQTKEAIDDFCPEEGFRILKEAGFSHVDFSLNKYMYNREIYQKKNSHFFDKSGLELEEFFSPHKEAAAKCGITIGQMHMPYPAYVPQGRDELNDYLWNEMAPKSMQVCNFLGCQYIVIHGFKLAYFLGSEEAEWVETERFIRYLAPMAKEMGITVCVENIYDNINGHIVEGPCCNVDKVVERIDRINEQYGAEVLGFCFDTGHANLLGIDFEHFITRLGHRLKVLHVHDNDGIQDLHQIPFTFTRSRENFAATDWDGFVKGLRNIGFDGVISFETAPVLTAFPVEMRKDVLGFIAKIGRYFVNRINA
ncbi:MAG: sugar phosphate isomerase/epimerase [Schwartzia succinivorans]|uniref:sugar phosphate isomerase/epimerase family protein n=1 Tax=Schwartzia succinivorans TaxID=55507 RepID=UPI002357390C|nr:sugar phosphate isomerase/epimerase family protein [Schwartzia succinivorans]MBE6096651.1 sugar phosphate isomerase/epimerase [Schwartzia succinivorans]